MKRHRLAVSFLVAAVFAAAAYAPATASAADLWIAALGPLTGDAAIYGQVQERAVLFAVEQINAAGGVKGATVRVQREDDKCSPKDSALLVQKLQSDPKILAIVGSPCSGANLANVPILNSGPGPVLISGISTSPKLSGSSKWWFRTTVTDDETARGVARLILKQGAKRVVLETGIYEAPQSFTATVRSILKPAGVVILEDLEHQPGEKDFSALVTRIKSHPDVDWIVVSDYIVDAALFVRQARAVGIKTPMIGSDCCGDKQFVEVAGVAATEGFLYSDYWHPDDPSPEAQAFVKAWKARFPVPPIGYEAASYDAARMVLDSMINGGTTREAIRNYLEGYGTKHPAWRGVTGEIKFDADHDPGKTIVVVEIKGGKVVRAAIQPPLH